MKRNVIVFTAALCLLSCSGGPADGTYTFQLFTTNDVHGRYFDESYVDSTRLNSLYAVSFYVDSVRNAVGRSNVILVDAGDCLQGDNAAYYFNYVDTLSPHLYARMADYMRYDAVAVGNHDIETGHKVYDRIVRQMKTPFLAANARDLKTGCPYFRDYVIIERHGVRIAILGFTNPNIRNWLSPALWSGMTFESLIPAAQELVDEVVGKEKPHAVIVAVHSGTGSGDGTILESQGLDLFRSLKGVDFLVCSHDHRPFTECADSICLINSGSHCRYIGHGTLTMQIRDGECVSKEVSAGLIPVRRDRIDLKMKRKFAPDFDAVRKFTSEKVGQLECELVTKYSYKGMCDYMNLLHTVSLSCPPAQISFAAPLTFNGRVAPGELIYNDLFTIYPFENQLYVVRMTGKEIKDYLEFSYEDWIYRVSNRKTPHLLKIVSQADSRTGQDRWSFVGRAYNFDSAGGLCYTVDVTAPAGERVIITSLADGTQFDLSAWYNVAMTSYRASGGGDIMRSGAGIDTDNMDSRIVERYPDIRSILYDFIRKNGVVTSELVGSPEVIGKWSFEPSEIAGPMLDRDLDLMFR